MAASIKQAKHWYDMEYIKEQIEKEKLRAELAYLKAQINPHFMFNKSVLDLLNQEHREYA